MAQEDLETSTGQWMNKGEISSLGATWSDQELNEILVYGFKPVPSRERDYFDENSRQTRKITEYFIDSSLIGIFLPRN